MQTFVFIMYRNLQIQECTTSISTQNKVSPQRDVTQLAHRAAGEL